MNKHISQQVNSENFNRWETCFLVNTQNFITAMKVSDHSMSLKMTVIPTSSHADILLRKVKIKIKFRY